MPKDIIIEEVDRRVKLRRTCDSSEGRQGFHRVYDVPMDFSNYAPLMPTTILEEGDEYYENGIWWPTSCVGQTPGKMFQYRRPLDNIIRKTNATQ